MLRCLKIAKYLRQFGWEPVIYTAADAHYPSIDPTNERDVPPDATILRQPIWEPYYIYKRLTGKPPDANVNNVFYVQDGSPGFMHHFSVWMRSNFFIPDARAAWIAPSVRFLRRYLRQHPVDAIFSDGPPHTNTRIATLLKQHTGIPWLADFQDPWTQVDYFAMLRLTPWGRRRHERMEQEAFRWADRITIVSPSWAKDLEAIGAQRVSVIPWGFDPEDYTDLPVPDTHKFALTHTGIMGHDRNAPALFEALRALCETEPGFAQHLELRLVGQVDFSVQEAIRKAGLQGCLRLPGSVDRRQALQLAASSAVLLLLLNQQPNAMGRIPGKLFEYLALRRPILVLGPTQADAAHITKETAAGHAFAYGDLQGIQAAVLQWYRAWKAGVLSAPLRTSIEAYSNVSLTARIAALLDEITTSSP